MQSNYEKMKDAMAVSFLDYDQVRMIRRFALPADRTYLYVTFVGRRYRIGRDTGRVQGAGDGMVWQDADYNEAMTIYDVLCNAKDGCHAANRFQSLNSISALKTGNLAQNGGIFQQTAGYFQGKTAQFRKACQALGGEELEHGDAAYRLALFPFLSVVLRFWDADDEFPASLQILVDENTLDFMHYETLMFALSHVFRRLKEEAGG